MTGPRDERHRARLATVAFVTHGDHLLLLRHPAGGDRFPGRWNGVGGHVEAGEDLRAAARRELREEAGLDVPGLRLRGVVHETGLLGSAYVIFFFVGEAPERGLRPAPGVEVAWHPRGALSALPLVPDLEVLLPRLLEAGEPLLATETYDGGDGLVHVAFSGDPP